jgi:hypothetical protein
VKGQVLAILLALLLAGCAGKGSGPAESTPTEATGVLKGVVVDAGIRPVAGALAELSTGANTPTDDGGNFVFPPMAPGTYVLRVHHPDFAQAESPLTISPGVTTEAKVTLVPLRSPVPLHLTQAFKGRIEAGLGILNDVGQTVLDALGEPNCKCSFNMVADVGLRAALLEAVWKDSVDPGPYGKTIYSWNVDTGQGKAHGAGNSPLYKVLVPKDFAAATGGDAQGHLESFNGTSNLHITLYPDQTWPAIQQEYDLYITLWFNGLPPEGWTFVGGSK